MKHAFSIDLEDWYQGMGIPESGWSSMDYRLERGLDVILGLLVSKKIYCTFFCLGWLAENYPQVIKQVSAMGHEIGSHGYNHAKLYDLSRDTFREETKKTKGLLEDLTGKPVVGFRAPYFSVTRRSLWALEVLCENGFEYDCSISPVETWRYGISSCPDRIFHIEELGLIEFPISTFSFFGKKVGVGGAYFRIFPYRFFDKFFADADLHQIPGMFYAHPWEFDPEHPVVRINWKARTTHYFNLQSMREKTEKLLSSFSFAKVSEVIENYRLNRATSNVSLKSLSS